MAGFGAQLNPGSATQLLAGSQPSVFQQEAAALDSEWTWPWAQQFAEKQLDVGTDIWGKEFNG